MQPEQIKILIREVIKEEFKSGLFTSRKITDMPTDDLQIVNRKYVNMYGTSANRPTSSVIGQQYFDTTLGYPIYWGGTEFVKYDGTSA